MDHISSKLLFDLKEVSDCKLSSYKISVWNIQEGKNKKTGIV